MKSKLEVNINDIDYLYKTRNKKCYFCRKPVPDYVPRFCICSQPDCPLCSQNKPANIPICGECTQPWVDRKNGKNGNNGNNGKKKGKKKG